MAVGWMSALKLVPWGEVIEATPQIAQAARRLLGATEKAPPPDAATPKDTAADHIAALRQRVQALEEEQRASAVLIQSLAEQNAQVVRAIDALRVRCQRLAIAACVLGVGTTGLLAWALTR